MFTAQVGSLLAWVYCSAIVGFLARGLSPFDTPAANMVLMFVVAVALSLAGIGIAVMAL